MLVEVVDVAVEDFDEELDGYGGIHAGIGDTEGALQTFENAFAVTVELCGLVGRQLDGVGLSYVLDVLPTFFVVLFFLRWECLDWDRPPQVTREVNSTALVWLLEQFAAV